MCNKAMKNMFQKIQTIKSKPLSQGQKVPNLMTEIGGEWYMEQLLLPIRIPKLSKKSQVKYD